MRGWSRGRIVVVVAAILVINLPYLGHLYEQHRLSADGVHVTATVVAVSPAGSDLDVGFKLPASIDSDQTVRTARVDRATGMHAQTSHTIGVTVLRSTPGVNRVDGQVTSRAPLVVTLVADAALVLLIVLAVRKGGRRRPTLEAVALGDLVPSEEEYLLDKQDDGTYVIQGEVRAHAGGTVLLGLRDREVTVHLREHEAVVDVGGRGRVRAQLVG